MGSPDPNNHNYYQKYNGYKSLHLVGLNFNLFPPQGSRPLQ